MILLNKEGFIFAGQRLGFPEAWQLPQGGIDEGEIPYQAALRELKEEIGTANVSLIAESEKFYHYDFPLHLQPHIWQGRYKGQKQKWFLFRFLGEDKEINIQTEHPEFSDWRWVKPEQLKNIAVDFKTQLYQDLYNDFKGHFTKDS